MTIGDVILKLDIIGEFVCLGCLDEEVAQTWVLRRAPDARIMKHDLTSKERPMKDWERGRLVIVEDYEACVLGILRMPKGYFILQKKK